MIPPPRKILLIQLRRLGDVVITTALAADLRRAFPNARLDFMVGRPAAPLLLNNPDVDEVVLFRTDQMLEMISEVRRRRYDWLIDVQAHPRTAILAMFSGVPVRAGWNARFWGMAYTHRIPRDTTPMYVVQNRRRLLEMLGVTPGNSLPVLHLSDTEREQGRADARELGLSDDAPIVALALGTHDPARDWRIDGFAELTTKLEAEGVRVLVFRFPGDDDMVAEFRRHTSAGVVCDWRGDRRFLAILARCSVMVSANTGPSHMALALGVPRVTIYGSTNPILWSPGLPTTVAIDNARQACLGCGTRSCPVDRQCIRGIGVAEVKDAVTELLCASR